MDPDRDDSATKAQDNPNMNLAHDPMASFGEAHDRQAIQCQHRISCTRSGGSLAGDSDWIKVGSTSEVLDHVGVVGYRNPGIAAGPGQNPYPHTIVHT